MARCLETTTSLVSLSGILFILTVIEAMLRSSPRQESEGGTNSRDLELKCLLGIGQSQQDEDDCVDAEDEAYRQRVEAAKATCRQRRYCTYGVLVLYLILIYLYLRRRRNE